MLNQHNYTVGSILIYETFGLGDSMRTVEVIALYDDVKNFRPGFDAVVIESDIPGEKGLEVWGYDYQIKKVLKR